MTTVRTLDTAVIFRGTSRRSPTPVSGAPHPYLFCKPLHWALETIRGKDVSPPSSRGGSPQASHTCKINRLCGLPLLSYSCLSFRSISNPFLKKKKFALFPFFSSHLKSLGRDEKWTKQPPASLSYPVCRGFTVHLDQVKDSVKSDKRMTYSQSDLLTQREQSMQMSKFPLLASKSVYKDHKQYPNRYSTSHVGETAHHQMQAAKWLQVWLPQCPVYAEHVQSQNIWKSQLSQSRLLSLFVSGVWVT